LIVIGDRSASTRRFVSISGLFLKRREKCPKVQHHGPQRQDHGQREQE